MSLFASTATYVALASCDKALSAGKFAIQTDTMEHWLSEGVMTGVTLIAAAIAASVHT